MANIVGTSLDDVLQGSALDDVIDGGDGHDTLMGGDGDDEERGGNGNDILYGELGNDILLGGLGNDILNGGSGNDTMTGGLGDDIYVVDSVNDVVIELPGEGLDTVKSSIDFTLGLGMDRLELLGNADLNGTGNGGANDLIGNAGNNVLSGGAGNDYLYGGAGTDTLIGGTGNDVYAVDEETDVVIEQAGDAAGRMDTVYSVASNYTLAANVEILELAGTGHINGTGNALSNSIAGNSGNNTLNGGAGNDLINGRGGTDILLGGLGDDRIIVDSADDTVIELAGEGSADEIQSLAADYTLPDHVERILLLGSSNNSGTGNALNNILQGNSGDNTLSGLAGNDFLNGFGGSDTLIGGTGNDIYFLWDEFDTVVENAGEGVDSVRSQVSYTLPDHVENLQLWFHYNLDATGNDLNNALIGNIGNNTLTGLGGNDLLDGFGGIDTLIGGEGADTYIVRTGLETIVELEGEGRDTIRSLVDYTLGPNEDFLILLKGDLDGTGNELGNYLTGTDGVNTLRGGGGFDILQALGGDDIIYGESGDDWLLGGFGDDQLYGGTGHDHYMRFIGDFGHDIIYDEGGTMDMVCLIDRELSEILSFNAVDSNGDTFVDDLYIDFGNENSITIVDYYDNTSADYTQSGYGVGGIETMGVLIDGEINFYDMAQVEGLIA